jgi:hypothetical protein
MRGTDVGWKIENIIYFAVNSASDNLYITRQDARWTGTHQAALKLFAR